MSNAPSYFEIGVPDGAKARAFYERVFPDWTFHPMGEGEQAWIETTGIRGGFHDQDAEARIELFFAVDDVEVAVRTVRDAGAGPTIPRRSRKASAVSRPAATTRASALGYTSRADPL